MGWLGSWERLRFDGRKEKIEPGNEPMERETLKGTLEQEPGLEDGMSTTGENPRVGSTRRTRRTEWWHRSKKHKQKTNQCTDRVQQVQGRNRSSYQVSVPCCSEKSCSKSQFEEDQAQGHHKHTSKRQVTRELVLWIVCQRCHEQLLD